MPIDEQELYEFIGETRQVMRDNSRSIEKLGERLGELEKCVYASKTNGWKIPAVYVGGGGISALGLIELTRLIGGVLGG